jgi:hypothetical protein
MNASVDTLASARAPMALRLFHWWLAQVRHMLPPTIYFFLGFNLVLWTKSVVLQQHGIHFSGFATATFAALLVGKAVLVTDKLPFMRRFDGAPLIQPILFKTTIYWLCVLAVRFAETLIDYVGDGHHLGDFPRFLLQEFTWSRFLMTQVWLMMLFLIYVTAHELDRLFGDGELYRLFFRWHSSQAKLTRRQRIRLLKRLSDLTDAHPVETFRDPATPAHRELLDILQRLARKQAVAAG